MFSDILLLGISGIPFLYCIVCTSYNLLFAIASKFYINFSPALENPWTQFLVLIPAYKEDEIILDSVKKNLSSVRYNESSFSFVVIADQLKQETIKSLKKIDPKVYVHEVNFIQSTKVKSLNSAIKDYSRKGFDYIVILDADNIMHPNFLKNINICIKNGYLAIQGRRMAKNKNNSLSILDGLSEEINNSIFRKGGNVLGLSSPISGSGMAFKYELLENILSSESALGGFDKMLQVRIIEQNIKIRFCENAVVYDEKTDDKDVFKNQRKRWLNSHFLYFTKFLRNGIRGILRFNYDLFNLTVFIHGLLPRSFNIIIIGLMLFISFFTPDIYFLKFNHWLLIFLSFVTANLIAIPKEYLNIDSLRALRGLPVAFLNMFLALIKIKESNKSFIHTPHKKHRSNE